MRGIWRRTNLQNDKKKSEERAIDALMAAAFRVCNSDETVSEKEAERLAAHPPRLSEEDEAAIESLGSDFVKKLLERSDTEIPHDIEKRIIMEKEIEEAYAAMNRQLGDKDLSDETRREIERKRRELLGGEDSKEGERGGT